MQKIHFSNYRGCGNVLLRGCFKEGSICLFFIASLSGRRLLIADGHHTAQYTILLPSGRDTVHCLYGVIYFSPRWGESSQIDLPTAAGRYPHTTCCSYYCDTGRVNPFPIYCAGAGSWKLGWKSWLISGIEDFLY